MLRGTEPARHRTEWMSPMFSSRRTGTEIPESSWRESRRMCACSALAIALFFTIFLCHLINSMESCYDGSTAFAVCMVVVAVISETVALAMTAPFHKPTETAISTKTPAMRRFGIYGLSPPHIRRASFLTPLRI